MDNFEFFEDKDVIQDSISIIEYLKNDFIVIKDFLSNLSGSPWDFVYTIKHNIDNEDLVMKKKQMVNSILSVYYYHILHEIQEHEMTNKAAKSIDDLHYLFFTDESYTIKILKYYISYLSESNDIKIDTKNYFMYDIENLREILISERDIMGINYVDYEVDEKEFGKKYTAFTYDLFNSVMGYIDSRISEDESFIKYLFSLVYAYIKNNEENDMEVDESEKEFLDIVDCDIDLVEYFYKEKSIVAFLLEHINASYLENVENYDLRKNIGDTHSQVIFRNLDDNYDDEFEKDILINDITMDSKLEIIMKFFKNQLLLPDIGIGEEFSNNSIKELLDGTYSIYEPLVAVGLDGRFQEVYRIQIIRKYVADVYEYLGYLKNIPNHETEKDLVYNELDKLDGSWESICIYFEENYSTLMDLWYEYFSKGDNYKINACLEAKKSGNYKKIYKFNIFSVYRYLLLLSKNIRKLKSVDCMNQILKQLNTGKIDLSNFDNPEDICKIICLNVYERLIICDDIDIEYREILNILNNELNLTDYLSEHQDQFFNIIKLYKKINRREVTYDNECSVRKQITDERYVKVLKRLNPYNE